MVKKRISLRQLEEMIAEPTRPKSTLKTEDIRFPAVISGKNLQQSHLTSDHVELAGSVFRSQAYKTENQRDFAKWVDHRELVKARIKPDRLPKDVPDFLMQAVEDMRACEMIRRLPQLEYDVGYSAMYEFLNKYGYSSPWARKYAPSWESMRKLEKAEEGTTEASAAQEELNERMQKEMLGVISALPYVIGPAAELLKEQVKESFHPKMQLVLETLRELFSKSDLSFAESHRIARILRDMLEGMPEPPEDVEVELELEVGLTGTLVKGEGETDGEGLEGVPKGPGGSGDDTDPFKDKNTVDWSKWEHTPRSYAPNVAAQLKRVRNNAYSYGNSYWSDTYGSPTYIPSGYRQGKSRFSRYQGGLEPGKLHIKPLKLTHQTVAPNEVGRGYRHVAHESGRVPKNMHRWATDKRIFSTKRHRKGGIALLIDMSGSMSLSLRDIDNILKKVPASIIAGYSGSGDYGELVVVAKDGRRVGSLSNLRLPGCGNIVDIPALHWLAKQKNTGKYWLTDGGVTGIGDSMCPYLVKEADDICVEHDIFQVSSASRLMNVIFEGLPLRKRATQRVLEETFECQIENGELVELA